MRSALAALVTAVLLTAGCSDDGPSVNYPDQPLTPSETETTRPARLHWKVAEPVIESYLGVYSQEDAEEVWNLAINLVKKWHLNPKLLQARHYRPREFLPVANYMTPERASMWRKDVRNAIRGVDLGGEDIDYVALRNVFSLVVWNLPAPQAGNWSDPMVVKPTIEGGVLPAIDGLRVAIKVTARFRIDRGVVDGAIPYSTSLQFYYRQPEDSEDSEDEWALDVYSGKWKLGDEVADRPKKKRSGQGSDESPSSATTSAG
jgi:hypothetical protein